MRSHFSSRRDRWLLAGALLVAAVITAASVGASQSSGSPQAGHPAAGGTRARATAVTLSVKRPSSSSANLVLSTAAPGTVRLTVPAATRTDEWTIQSAVVVGDVNGDGVPDIAVAVDHFHHPSPFVIGGRCSPPPPPLPHDDFVQVIFGGPLPAKINLADPKVAGFRITAPLGSDQL